MNTQGVSIIIPHYQTEKLAKLCLRSIRFYTKTKHEVLVIDNGSTDGSLEYLRQVKWIKLIERDKKEVHPEGEYAHKEAMDIGIEQSTLPYILSFHTDSIAIHHNWLEWLLGIINDKPDIGAVGSYKLEIKTRLELFLKRLDHTLRPWKGVEEGTKENPAYIRSHCALYRRDVLEKLGLKYMTTETAGRNIHFGMIAGGYQALLIPSHKMLNYILHLNHATRVLNPELGSRAKTVRKGLARINTLFSLSHVQKILEDDSLDN